MRRSLVTGVGLVTSLGIGLEATWSSLLEGQSGLSTSEGLTEAAYVRCPAIAKLAKFRGNRYLKNRKSIKLMTRPVQLGMAAAKLAFEGAGLQEDQLDPERFGVFVGAGQAFADRRELETALDRSRTEKGFDMVAFGTQGMDMIHPLWLLRGLSNNVLGFVSLEYNAQGINNNYCNSGVSSIQAITAGMHAIREGYADLVFAGGYDSIIGEEGLLGYGRLGLLATEQEGVSPHTAHRPFGAARTGLIPGEGACFVMLESTAHAQARGAQPMAQLMGGGVCSGAYGITDPDPAGTKLRLALAEASRDARVSLDSVEALFAHGAGSVTFDPIEVQVYREAMGAQAAQRVLATADKGQVGHTMCAAGAISTGLAVQALASGRVPAMGGTQTVDRACAGLDWVLEESREATVGRALVSSAGLGGQAAALLLDRA